MVIRILHILVLLGTKWNSWNLIFGAFSTFCQVLVFADVSLQVIRSILNRFYLDYYYVFKP